MILPQMPQQRIRQYAAELKQKHDYIPGWSQRVDKAAQILASNTDLYAHGSRWICLSQSHDDGTGYYCDRMQCECPDFRAGRVRFNGRTYCKHRFALVMYLHFIDDEINKRIIGNGDAANRHRQEAQPNTWLILIRGGLWSDHSGYVSTVHWSDVVNRGGGYRPADHIAAAEWLGQAEPRPEERPATLSDTSEWQLQLTAEQLRRWKSHGSVW